MTHKSNGSALLLTALMTAFAAIGMGFFLIFIVATTPHGQVRPYWRVLLVNNFLRALIDTMGEALV